jgi:fatty-acyl-CoA synthase
VRLPDLDDLTRALRDVRRMVSGALGTGALPAQTVRGLARTGWLLRDHPLGIGLVHALWARNVPDREAVVDGARRVTYATFDEQQSAFVHGLRGLGLGPRDPIAVASPNGWAYLVAFFGALRGRHPIAHASWRLTPPELEHVVAHAGARVLLVSPEAWPPARDLRERGRLAGVHLLATGPLPGAPEVTTLEAFLRAQPRGFPPGPSTGAGPHLGANVVYTSGTTGRPKGAVRDLGAFGIVDLFRLVERIPVREGDRHLVACPLYHSAAQAFALLHAALGGTLVTAPGAGPEDLLATLVAERIDTTLLVPTQVHRLLALPEASRQRLQPRLRLLATTGAPFPHPLRMQALEWLGPVLCDLYGTTEAGLITAADGAAMRRKPGTLGQPLPETTVRVLGADGESLPPGQIGEVHVASAQVMAGYHRDAAATAGARRDGAQATGDLGYLDADGDLFLVGRSVDLIISGGVNVYPAEIEPVLLTHPAVTDAAVVGLPDAEWGEVVAAFLVGPTEADLADVARHCRAHLAPYKIPRRLVILDALPRNALGKVLKRELRGRPPG